MTALVGLVIVAAACAFSLHTSRASGSTSYRAPEDERTLGTQRALPRRAKCCHTRNGGFHRRRGDCGLYPEGLGADAWGSDRPAGASFSHITYANYIADDADVLFKAREPYFDPAAGRWTQTDALRQLDRSARVEPVRRPGRCRRSVRAPIVLRGLVRPSAASARAHDFPLVGWF